METNTKTIGLTAIKSHSSAVCPRVAPQHCLQPPESQDPMAPMTWRVPRARGARRFPANSEKKRVEIPKSWKTPVAMTKAQNLAEVLNIFVEVSYLVFGGYS